MKSFKMESFGRVRERALSLYDALSRGWKCQCENPHLANLRLEARKHVAPQVHAGIGGEQEEIRFKFLFSFTAPSADQNKGAGPLDWYEAELAPLDDIDAAKRLSASSSREHNASSEDPAGNRDGRAAAKLSQ